MDEITFEELKRLQELQPDDSVSISPYADMSPQEAAKIADKLEKKVGNMDVDEEQQYVTAQQIADRGGVLPDNLKPGDGPFLDDQDMMKKEGE